MTGIRHFTASATVFDDHERVLLVHHNKLRQWLYAGGHIDPNEDPAQAAIRELKEESGVDADAARWAKAGTLRGMSRRWSRSAGWACG